MYCPDCNIPSQSCPELDSLCHETVNSVGNDSLFHCCQDSLANAQALAIEASRRLSAEPGIGSSQQPMAGHLQELQPSLADGDISQLHQRLLGDAMTAALQQQHEQQLPTQLAAVMQQLPGRVAAAVQQAMPLPQTSSAADAMYRDLTAISQQLMSVVSDTKQMQAAQAQQLPVLNQLEAQLPEGIAGMKVLPPATYSLFVLCVCVCLCDRLPCSICCCLRRSPATTGQHLEKFWLP